MSFFNTASSSTMASNTMPEKDVEVADPPPDSISSLSFSPQADYLAAGSWDNNVRVSCSLSLAMFRIPFGCRYESTRSGRMVRHRERLCIRIKGQYWRRVGIRCERLYYR